MTTKNEQILLLKHMEHVVKNFHDIFNTFLEEWSNLCNQIDFNTFDGVEREYNPILKNLEAEYSKKFRSIKFNLQTLVNDFDFNNKFTLSNKKKPGKRADQIALVKKLQSVLKNFQNAFHEYLDEWNSLYEDLTFEEWDDSFREENPILERLENYYATYFRNTLKNKLKEILKDFDDSFIAKDVFK